MRERGPETENLTDREGDIDRERGCDRQTVHTNAAEALGASGEGDIRGV